MSVPNIDPWVIRLAFSFVFQTPRLCDLPGAQDREAVLSFFLQSYLHDDPPEARDPSEAFSENSSKAYR